MPPFSGRFSSYIRKGDMDLITFKEKGKININSADETELQEIPGVGEVTAKKIIEYREQNGKFKNIEDIKNVKGIGEGKYEEMKENICIK